MRPIVTLLTDFGTADAYVAAMKGVILSLAPDAAVVDAAHGIAPQNVRAGAWVLGQYAFWYPEGSIHVAVVDPGVGTSRDALLVNADGRVFLAPDNGLLAWVLKQAANVELRKLRPDVHGARGKSSTFHGRDVFAHAAGLLAGGKSAADISVEAESVVMPSWAFVHDEGDCLVGEVIHVDRFGNLISNITRKQVAEKKWGGMHVRCGDDGAIRVVSTYGDAEDGELIALFGSSGTLEVAVNGGSAAERTSLVRGAAVLLRKATGRD